MMSRESTSAKWARMTAAMAVTAGCGGGSPGFGGTDTAEGGAGAPGASDGSAMQSDAPSRDSGGSSLFGDDASLPTSQADCLPGTYAGQFTCDVSALLIIKFPWSGSISLTLVGQESGGGEFPTLTIAPGAKIMGTDSNGGTFTGDLTGALDCATRQLTGTMTNGVYQNKTLNLSFGGALSAGYDTTATPRAFVKGAMGPLKSPQLPTVVGTCTWTAALK